MRAKPRDIRFRGAAPDTARWTLAGGPEGAPVAGHAVNTSM